MNYLCMIPNSYGFYKKLSLLVFVGIRNVRDYSFYLNFFAKSRLMDYTSFMNTYMQTQSYQMPYLWPYDNKEIIFNDIEEHGFRHIHIHGSAGMGKTRCIHEILETYKSKSLVVEYSSNSEQALKHSVAEKIQSRFTGKHFGLLDSQTIFQELEKASTEENIIIAIDDLHYHEDDRDAFIEKLISHFDGQNNNITLITASRNSFDLLKPQNFHNVEIGHLSNEDASSLVEYGCKKNKTLAMLKNNVIKNSQGNPLYISEAMNILFQASEDPCLQLDLQKFFNAKNIDQLYETLILTLNDVRKDVLLAASVIGKSFEYADLLHLLPNHKLYLPNILKYLCDKKFLLKMHATSQYSFTHDKQREIVYNNIDFNNKSAWHIALFQRNKKFKKYELCAYHLYYAEKFYEAVPYLTYTARKLLKSAQPKRAEFYFLKAFKAMEKSGLAMSNSFFRLKFDYCQSLIMQGEVYKLRPIIENLKRNKNFLEDEKLKANILKIEIPFKWISSEYDEKYAIDLLGNLPNNTQYMNERFRLLGMLVDMGSTQEAITGINDFYNNLLNHKKYVKEVSFAPMNVTLNAVLANAYAQKNEKLNAITCINKCLASIKITNLKAEKIYGLAFCAKAFQSLEMYDQAKPLIEESYKLNQDSAVGVVTPDILSIYADNLTSRGEYFKAFFLFDNLMSMIENKGICANKALNLTLQAKAYYKFGITEMPINLLSSAIDFAKKHNNRYQESYAAYELSNIYFETNQIEYGILYSNHAKRISRQIESNLLSLKIDALVRKHVSDLTHKNC